MWREVWGKAGWIVHHPVWDLDTFLKQHRPSQITSPDIFWVHISGPPEADRVQPLDAAYIHCLMRQLQLTTGGTVTAEDIKAIAEATRNTQGKWIIYRKSKDVDELWDAIARSVHAGNLGSYVKISSRNSAMSARNQEHAIHVYTRDYTNIDDVMRIERNLRELGVTGELTYKPDIYQTLGIFFKNPWNISPNIYTTMDP